MQVLARSALIAGLFAVTSGTAPDALAFGALAVSEPEDVAKDGLAMGWSADIGSQDAASAEALDWCKKGGEPKPKAETRALCKVVLTFQHQCIAVVLDNKPHTPGRGWALGATKEEAAAAAMTACKETAGADRAAFCEISINDCDVVP
jgi:hypothetical protein